MELSTAIRLIQGAIGTGEASQSWADLGAGSGLFTRALGSQLPHGSSVLAVDKDESSLRSIPWSYKDVHLNIQLGDFTTLNWKGELDGILLANSLHYVSDQLDFLRRIKGKLTASGRIAIVEYDRTYANPWVPYPITYGKLTKLASEIGFSQVEKLEEAPSVYDGSTIYSSLIIV